MPWPSLTFHFMKSVRILPLAGSVPAPFSVVCRKLGRARNAHRQKHNFAHSVVPPVTEKMSPFYVCSVTGGLQSSEFLVNADVRAVNRYCRLCKREISRENNGFAGNSERSWVSSSRARGLFFSRT
jgi:hypothetical protein